MPSKPAKSKPAKSTRAIKQKAAATAATRTRTSAPAKSISEPASFSPTASRPLIPAGYRMTEGTDGLLEWPWARKRLTDSHNYLIITVRPDGRPHAMPMHGLWHGDAYYFGTDDDTRKAKNLAENPRCIVVNERFDEATIVEGVAERVPAALLDKETVGMLNAACRKKYGWPMTHGQNSVVWRVSPKVVFAFPLKKIATGVTRWIFP